jgi:hypothetical protein
MVFRTTTQSKSGQREEVPGAAGVSEVTMRPIEERRVPIGLEDLGPDYVMWRRFIA